MQGTHNDRLRAAYDRKAQERNQADMQDWKVRERGRFLELLITEGKTRLLEIGAGPGRDSLFFQQQGLDVISSDLSFVNTRLCLLKGLVTCQVDLSRPPFSDECFDSVFALNCLLHIPRRLLDGTLLNLRRLLVPGGLFFMGLYGGKESEGIYEGDHYDPRRFFAMYTDTQILKAVRKYFHVLRFETIQDQDADDIHFQCMILRRDE